MTYVLKTHRLANSKKLTDRFLACQINTSLTTPEAKEKPAGYLFSLVEILNPWFPTSQIGQTIINTVAREYYRAHEPTAAENFEFALKRVNEALAGYTQNGETEWIGKLHAVFALLYKDEIYFTAVGQPHVLLLREGKIINISEETTAGQDEIHPLRTFANITTGKLELGDVLIIANPDLINHFTLSDLQRLVELNPLPQAAEEIAGQLIQKTITTSNLILLEVCSKEDVANEQISDTPETLYLDEYTNSFLAQIQHYYKHYLRPPARTIATNLRFASRFLAKWTTHQGLPALHHTLKDTRHYLHQSSGKIHQHISKINLSKPSVIREENIKITDEGLPPLVGTSYHVRHYRRRSLIYRLSHLPQTLSHQLSFGHSYIRELFTNHNYRAYLYILLFVIITGFLSISIYYKSRQSRQSPTTTSSNQLTEDLQKQYNQAVNTEPNQAVTLLQGILTTFSQNGALKSDQRSLYNKTNERLALLTRTTSLTTPTTLAPPSNCQNIFSIGNLVYALDSQGSIYQAALTDQAFSLAARLPANAGTILASAGPTSNGAIIILTSNNQLYEFSTSSSQLKPVTKAAETNWPTTDSLATYNTNIYLLDGKQGSLLKYVSIDSQYGPGTSYTNNPRAQLADAKSITIDGNIYVLRQDGSLARLKKDEVTDIIPSGFLTSDQAPRQLKQILTQENNDYLFLLSDHRFTLISKSGAYEKEFLLTDDTIIQHAAIQTAQRRILLSTAKNLFMVTY